MIDHGTDIEVEHQRYWTNRCIFSVLEERQNFEKTAYLVNKEIRAALIQVLRQSGWLRSAYCVLARNEQIVLRRKDKNPGAPH